MSRKIVICFFLVLILLIGPFCGPNSASAFSIYFDPNYQEVPVGSLLEVSIMVDMLPFYEENSSYITLVRGFEFYITFDPAILAFEEAEFGPYLGDPSDDSQTKTFFELSSSELVHLSETSYLALNAEAGDPPYLTAIQTEEIFPLATLTFNSLAEGSTLLTFSDIYITDDFNYKIYIDSDDYTLPGQVVVLADSAPVPEPSSVFLVITGLLGIGFIKKRIG